MEQSGTEGEKQAVSEHEEGRRTERDSGNNI